MARFAEVRRGGRCRIPADCIKDRVWKRLTGGFAQWWDHEAHCHTHQIDMQSLVQPLDPSDLSRTPHES